MPFREFDPSVDKEGVQLFEMVSDTTYEANIATTGTYMIPSKSTYEEACISPYFFYVRTAPQRRTLLDVLHITKDHRADAWKYASETMPQKRSSSLEVFQRGAFGRPGKRGGSSKRRIAPVAKKVPVKKAPAKKVPVGKPRLKVAPKKAEKKSKFKLVGGLEIRLTPTQMKGKPTCKPVKGVSPDNFVISGTYPKKGWVGYVAKKDLATRDPAYIQLNKMVGAALGEAQGYRLKASKMKGEDRRLLLLVADKYIKQATKLCQQRDAVIKGSGTKKPERKGRKKGDSLPNQVSKNDVRKAASELSKVSGVQFKQSDLPRQGDTYYANVDVNKFDAFKAKIEKAGWKREAGFVKKDEPALRKRKAFKYVMGDYSILGALFSDKDKKKSWWGLTFGSRLAPF